MIRLKNNMFINNRGTAIYNDSVTVAKKTKGTRGSTDVADIDGPLRFIDLGGNSIFGSSGGCLAIRDKVLGCLDFVTSDGLESSPSPSPSPSESHTLSPSKASAPPTVASSTTPSSFPMSAPFSSPSSSPAAAHSSLPTRASFPTSAPFSSLSSSPSATHSSPPSRASASPTMSSSTTPSSFPTSALFLSPSFPPSAAHSSPPSRASASPTVASSTTPSSFPMAAPFSSPSFPPSAAHSSSPSAAPVLEESALFPTQAPTTLAPTPDQFPPNPVPLNPRPGYFNYDPTDENYGPGFRSSNKDKYSFENNGWATINAKDTDEYKYWREFDKYLEPNLERNYCGDTDVWTDSRGFSHFQSPIHVRATGNKKCLEFHEIRDRAGDWRMDDVEVKKEIHSNKIRVVYPRRTGEEPDPPNADIPSGWQKQMDVIHIDIKIPAEHTLNGTEFPGEYQVYIISTAGRGAVAVSILMDLHPDDEDNPTFGIALNEFKKEFNKDITACIEKMRGGGRKLTDSQVSIENLEKLIFPPPPPPPPPSGSIFTDLVNTETDLGVHPDCLTGNIADGGDPCTSPGFWDPWHPRDILRTDWFYGYDGSTTEPPCYPIATFRIMDTPMLISRSQLTDLKKLIFFHFSPECEATSVHFDQSVARPIQQSVGAKIHRCTCLNFLSDKERNENPGRETCEVEEFCNYHECS